MSAHPLLVHPEVDSWLLTRPDLRRRVDWLLFELTTRGEAGRPKGIVGPSSEVSDAPRLRWRRSGVGGFHYYAWWFPAGGWDGIDDPRTVVVRAVRHHDEMRPLAAGDPATYQPRAFDALAPLTEEQQQVVTSSARIRLVVGQPGTGKTGALLFAAIREARALPPGARLLYVTLSRRLAAAAQELLDGIEGAGRRIEVVPLADLLARWSGRSTISATSEGDEERAFRGSVRGFAPRELAIWQSSDRALWAEVRAHVLGAALPFELPGLPASDGPMLSEYRYESRRQEQIGSKPAKAAWRAANVFVNRRDLPSVQREAWVALERLRSGTLFRELGDVGGVIVDEIQDLTPLQIAVLAEAAKRAGGAFAGLSEAGAGADGTAMVPCRPLDGAGSGASNGVLFVAAGDESQVVHPSGFEWGRCKDVLRAVLGGQPEEINLRVNQRSAAPLIEVANRTATLYEELPRDFRPRGSCLAETTDAPDGEVGEAAFATAAGDDADLHGWLALLADTPHSALVVDETVLKALPAALAADGRLRDLCFTPDEVKGLDRQYVVVWDASSMLRRLHEDVEAAREKGEKVRYLVARTAIDELRVAVSRATETLVLLDPPDTEPHAFLAGLLDEGMLRRRSAAFLWDRLRERDVDARERTLGFLDDASDLLEGDADRALRALVRVDAALANQLDPEQRKEPLERAVEVRRAAGRALMRQRRYREAADQYERLAQMVRELGHEPRAAQFAILARRYREAPPDAPDVAARLPLLLTEYLDTVERRDEGDRPERLFEVAREWIVEARGLADTDDRTTPSEPSAATRRARGRRAGERATIADPLVTLHVPASRLAQLSGNAGDRTLADELAASAADAMLARGDWAAALGLLKDQSAPSSEVLARCYEGLQRWHEAAGARIAAGQVAEALADFRRAARFHEAAELAERLGRTDEAGLLGALAELTAALDHLRASDLAALEAAESQTIEDRLKATLASLTRRRGSDRR